MSKIKFKDAYGRTIHDGSKVYFSGDFPNSMPVFEPEYYARYGVKHARQGWVHIINNMLVFVTTVGRNIVQTGLTWELDGEPCYDLVVIK